MAKGTDNQTARVTVTINVTDVNEAPKVTDSDGDPVTSPVAVNYAEDDGDAVVSYDGGRPRRVEGELGPERRGRFLLHHQQRRRALSFVNPPDFESPARQVRRQHGYARCRRCRLLRRNLTTIYSVLVRAIAARASGDTGPAQAVSFIVNVTVTDAEETGSIALSHLQPEATTRDNGHPDRP